MVGPRREGHKGRGEALGNKGGIRGVFKRAVGLNIIKAHYTHVTFYS